MKKDGTLTKPVLYAISRQLSTRVQCQRKEYHIKIFKDEKSGNDTIAFSPYLTCFPNNKHRKDTDRRNIIYHVISTRFPELLAVQNATMIQIKPGYLTHGTYIYKTYGIATRRKWYKESK